MSLLLHRGSPSAFHLMFRSPSEQALGIQSASTSPRLPHTLARDQLLLCSCPSQGLRDDTALAQKDSAIRNKHTCNRSVG